MKRLKSHRDFVAVLKRRHKVGGKDIVVHYVLVDDQHDRTDARRLGLAVSKSVGNAVVRNAVKRRFRVLARQYEHVLPNCCDIVLRAKPTAACADFAALDRQIASLFEAIARKAALR